MPRHRPGHLRRSNRRRQRRLALTLLLAALVAAAGLAWSATRRTPTLASGGENTAGVAATLGAGGGGLGRVLAQTPTSAAPVRLTAESLHGEFSELQARLHGPVAVAWTAVDEPDAVRVLGAVPDNEAWSTLKVPLSLAARENAGGTSREVDEWIHEAVVDSDNDAAVALWTSFDSDSDARSATNDILRRGGDTATQVKGGEFGLTPWEVGAQARFASRLPCLTGSDRVVELMRTHPDDQRWGLAATRFPTASKGGWGPSPNGYLVRQFGVLTLPDGRQVAVSVSAQPTDGSHETATAVLTALSAWLADRLTPADGGTCRKAY